MLPYDESFKDVLPEKYKNSLWKDELNDPFLLVKWGEIYRSGADTVKGHCISPKFFSKNLSPLCKTGVIFDVMTTDDPLVIFKSKIENLPLLMALGAFKRRPHKNGAFVAKREKALAHKISPYNPVFKEQESELTNA